MTLGWPSGAKLAPVERGRGREEPTFDPRSLGSLPPGFDDATRSILLHEALMERFNVTSAALGSGGAVMADLLIRTRSDVIIVECKGMRAEDVVAALRGSDRV